MLRKLRNDFRLRHGFNLTAQHIANVLSPHTKKVGGNPITKQLVRQWMQAGPKYNPRPEMVVLLYLLLDFPLDPPQ